MPAIHLPRLRRQAAELVEYFPRPELFIRHLRDMLEYYGDRTRRPNQPKSATTLLQAYQVPDPVLRQVLAELTPLAEAHPKAAIPLAEALWERPRLEFRVLAIQLTGVVPATNGETVFGVIERWAQANDEDVLLERLALDGLQAQRRQSPEELLKRINTWLKAETLALQQLGWRALLHLLMETHYENYPAIFELIAPYLPECPKALRPYARDLLAPMASRSPQEAAYFMRQLLKTNGNTMALTWLTRQMLEHLPADLRRSLRAEVGIKRSP